MDLIGFGLLLSSLATLVAPKEISGVFTSFDSLKWNEDSNDFRGPASPTWKATLGWSLDGTKVNPGDTFTLIMPCVFKFITEQTTIDLTANGVNYATCTFHAGEEFTAFSSVGCVVKDALKSNIQAFGTVTIPFTFNVGGTGTSVSLQDSTCFTTGDNIVTFQDGDNKLSITANFEPTGASRSDLIANARSIPSLEKMTHLVIAPDCPSGFKSGTISLNTNNGAYIDCAQVHVGMTNFINPWNYPTNSEQNFSKQPTCNEGSFTLSFESVPAGFRPFFDVMVTPKGKMGFDYKYSVVCADGESLEHPTHYDWGTYNTQTADSNGAILVITTRTGTQSTTSVTTLPFDPSKDHTKTVEVIEPI
ncbi:Agglutinin-like protein 6, partial [Candida tropicalis]